MRKKHLLIAAFLLLPVATYAAPSTSYTGSISYNNDNNLGLGSYGRDIVSDDSINLSASMSHTTNLNKQNRLVLNATANVETYSKFDGLNNNGIDVKLGYQFQFANQFRSPFYELYLLTGLSDYKSNFRDNTHTQYGFNISLRFDDRTLLRAGFSNESIDADSIDFMGSVYETFDAKRDSYYLGINITQTSKLSLYATVSMINGNITANWTSQTFDDYIAAGFANIRPAWQTVPDAIFGNGWESTKYTADITKLTLGFNYAFSSSNAIDTVFESLDADSGAYSYSIERFSLSYLHRF